MKKIFWVGLLFFIQNSHAGVFEDEEARKAINTIQGQLNNIQANIQNYVDNRVDQLSKKNNPIQIQNELKLLRELVAKLNGQIEVVQYEVSNLADKQKTLYEDINNRLADLEVKLNNLPSNSQLNNVQESVSKANDLKDNLSNLNKEPRADLGNLDSTQSVPAQEFSNQSSASQNASVNDLVVEYEPLPQIKPKDQIKEIPQLVDKNIELDAFMEAENLLRATKYKESFDAFDRFITAYPKSEKIVRAKYNLGYSQYALKNYRAAINTYSKIIEQYPQDPAVPETMYGIANCHIQLADILRAKQTLRDLIQNYPNAEIIPNAKSRLEALNSIKL